MSENGGYAVYMLYNALHLHFTTKSYDYFRYGGKTNAKKDTFLNNKNKYSFYKISRKYSFEETKNFFLSNFVDKTTKWIGELLTEEADEAYRKWQKRNQSLTYTFQNDILSLLDKYDTKDLLQVRPGRHPKLLEEVMQGRISIETLVILNDIMNFFPMWQQKIDDDIIWPDWKFRCEKYAPFVSYDKDKFKKFLIESIKQND
jgi:hypothetical protein